MAEKYPRPANADKVDWQNGTYGATDPAAQRVAGWADNEVPAAEEFNWLFELWGDFQMWLEDTNARVWSDVYEGIAAAANLDLFRVMPAATIQPRGTQVFKITGTGGGGTAVAQPCTDGEQIYYRSVSYIVGCSPADGAEIFDASDLAVGFSAICTDGKYVYAMTVDSGVTGLYAMGRDDGAEVDSAGSEYGCTRIAANGEYCAGIDPTTKAGYVVVYSGIQSAIVEDGTFDTGSADLRAIAIDETQCYVGGTQSTYDVWAVDLATHAKAWQITLPLTSAPGVEGIAADGNRVYVATDYKTLTAGGLYSSVTPAAGGANLFCLDRVSGALLWSMAVQDAEGATIYSLEGITTDGKYVYVVGIDGSSDSYLQVIDVRAIPAQVASIADFGDPCCDGVSVIGNSNLTTELKRLWMCDGVTTFQKVPEGDVARRPFYTLALPIDK